MMLKVTSEAIIGEKKTEKTTEKISKEARIEWISLKHWEGFALKIGGASREGLDLSGQKKIRSLNALFKQT
jgi:hypothetical protein